MNTEAKPAPEVPLTQTGKSGAPVKKLMIGGKPKAARAAKTTKTQQRSPHSSGAASSSEKLVCRYCGSDDLAPSFRIRCDARCRACFKNRYGSAPRDKKSARTRKTKARK